MIAPDDSLPLPLDEPSALEPRGRCRVRCRLCGRPLYGRQARLWVLGDDCRAKLQRRTAPRPPASDVAQDTIPGM